MCPMTALHCTIVFCADVLCLKGPSIYMLSECVQALNVIQVFTIKTTE